MTNTNTNTSSNDLQVLKICIHADIDRLKMRKSAWSNGVKAYMHDFIDYDDVLFSKLIKSQIFGFAGFEKILLNGANNWGHYSWGGCSLCYNYDILTRLCPASIIKKYENCSMVNGVELLDIQARALRQACKKLYNIMFVYSNLTPKQRKIYFNDLSKVA